MNLSMKNSSIVSGKKHHGYWNQLENQRHFMDQLTEQLGLCNMEDLYQISFREIRNQNGAYLMKKYRNSPSALLTTVYPKHPWMVWKFKILPHGYWNNKNHQINFMNWLGTQLGIKKMEDWYNLKQKDIVAFGGESLLREKYSNSPSKLLQSSYPEHTWLIWKFQNVPLNYWEKKENHRAFVDWLGTELGIRKMQDWYHIGWNQIKERGGEALLQKYNCSPSKLIQSVYPDHNWLPWKFHTVPVGYWDDKGNQKEFMDWFGKELSIEKMEDWYGVTFKDFQKHKGGSLIGMYQGSPYLLLKSLFPDHKWNVMEFGRLSSYRKGELDVQEAIELTDILAQKLRIRNWEDWYNVSNEQLEKVGSLAYLQQLSLAKLLPLAHPDYPWDIPKLEYNPGKKASQRYLALIVGDLFPNSRIWENFRHGEIRYLSSNISIELDIFLPDESLAFEYQGQKHHKQVYGIGSPMEQQRERDREKAQLCFEGNITLIDVPYWWDQTAQSLRTTVQSLRPDLLTDSETPLTRDCTL